MVQWSPFYSQQKWEHMQRPIEPYIMWSPSPLRPHLFIFVPSAHLTSSIHGLLVYWIYTTCHPPGPSSHSLSLECSLSNYSFASLPISFKSFLSSLTPTLTNLKVATHPLTSTMIYISQHMPAYDMQCSFLIMFLFYNFLVFKYIVYYLTCLTWVSVLQRCSFLPF